MDEDDLVSKQWPGFKVICLRCNSERVTYTQGIGWSEVSGSWGSDDLSCLDCDNIIAIKEG